MTPSTTLARAIVDGLLAAGVRHVVLAPGSRSAPLAYELQAADRAGRLTLHVRVDERTAGFLALGLAKLTRTPAAVVTTSGTAVANLHPAVLEAHHSLVPMIVLSADRPPELRGIGANQTTTQQGMFGEVTRVAAELDPLEGDPSAWADVLVAAVQTARGGQTSSAAVLAPPGPVHLNVSFREPLVPDLDDPVRDEWPDAASASAMAAAGGSERSGPEILRLPDRTLVVIGDLPEPDQARRVATWAGEMGWPVVAEPFGEQPLGRTVIPHGPLLLDASWYGAHRPEQLVVAGRVTLSRSVRRALTGDPARVTYLRAGPRWLGPSFDVGRTVDLDGALLWALRTPSARRRAWLATWRAAGAAVDIAVGGEPAWGNGPAVARRVVAALPGGSILVVGSSNSARDLELAVDWAGASPVRVMANRGVAGIDGVISTAAGIALAGGAATYALVGDLTFLHDANALLIGPDEPRPDLTIVVVNDDGGGIFGTLEPGEPARAADFERIFGTATGARIADLAGAYGIRYVRAASAGELSAAVAEPPKGLRVVEVLVDRRGHRTLREWLKDAAEQATARLVDPPEQSPGRPDRDFPERGMRV